LIDDFAVFIETGAMPSGLANFKPKRSMFPNSVPPNLAAKNTRAAFDAALFPALLFRFHAPFPPKRETAEDEIFFGIFSTSLKIIKAKPQM
jgi:hypothetical protein